MWKSHKGFYVIVDLEFFVYVIKHKYILIPISMEKNPTSGKVFLIFQNICEEGFFYSWIQF